MGTLPGPTTSLLLHISEIFLLISGLVLLVGLVGEYAKSPRWVKHVKVFEILVVLGVAGELIADGGMIVFTEHLQTIEGTRIHDLNNKADEAMRKVGDSVTKSEEGIRKADTAGEHAQAAFDKAKNSELIARSARQEAHSYEAQIASALKQASEAEAHLKAALAKAEEVESLAKGYEEQIKQASGDATESKSLVSEIRQLATDARSQVDELSRVMARLRAKRSISDPDGLVSSMKKFSGTEYSFDAVNGDPDSGELLIALARVLKLAGWKRIDRPAGLNGIVGHLDNEEINVAQLPRSGIVISVESDIPIALLRSFLEHNRRDRTPTHVQAAEDLREALYEHIAPHEDTAPGALVATPGKSTVVLISVGTKRL